MDVPLALNNIIIRHGFKGHKSKSSTFYHLVNVVGLFGLFAVMWNFGGVMIEKQFSSAL